MSKVTGKIKPLGNKVFVSDMDFGMQTTVSGIHIPSADGKAEGISPRWGKVWAIGETQKEVKIGEWILIEHGQWTRTVEVELEDGSIEKIRMVNLNAILMSTDEKPNQIYRRID
jgi:co-chaperonin GroES (HSP10)